MNASSTDSRRPTGRSRQRYAAPVVVLVRRALLPLVGLGLVVTVAALPFGSRAAFGALVGSVLVTVFFATTLLLMRLTAPMAPRLALGVALLAYWTKASLLGVLLLSAPALGWFDPGWFGGTVIGGTLVWMVLHVRGLAAARIPVVDPAADLERRAS